MHSSARATSAAPLYFAPFNHWLDGVDCRDGGLRDNNPAPLALSQSRVIWGDEAKVDLLLSLGTGIGNNPAAEPKGLNTLGASIRELFRTFLATMNGESAWKRFSEGLNARVLRRALRLNPRFSWEKEPALDDVKRIDEMISATQSYRFCAEPDRSPFAASINPSVDALVETALQLRASLFYFHLYSISRNAAKDVAVIKGYIFCRLIRPEQETAFQKLIHMTSAFNVNETEVEFNAYIGANETFKVPVLITKKLDTDLLPIRIDAVFCGNSIDSGSSQSTNYNQRVAISGFPVTIEVRN
jgi:hypothetical protein